VKARLSELWAHFSLAHQYMLASLVVLVGCMAGVGWWVSLQIQAGVIRETATTTALYMNSFVAPLIQELANQDRLEPRHLASLDRLVRETPLGRQVTSFKIWNREGRIVYSTNPELVGETYQMSPEWLRAWRGSVTSQISSLDHPENANERQLHERLLETYSPVRREDSPEIIAVAEFYQTVDALEERLVKARMWTWFVVGAATLVMYILLAGIVRRGSDTIQRQQFDLRDKVGQLTDLLSQNKRLSERLRRAATEGTARNERFLRRISAELHDGPAQTLGFALLRLDSVMGHSSECGSDKAAHPQGNGDLDLIQSSLGDALDEIRAFSSGLVLPELSELSLRETLVRVCAVHERRTDTEVEIVLDLNGVPEDASLPLKITIYRFVQEALANAYRHADGRGQKVWATRNANQVHVQVSDFGPGFEWNDREQDDEHLGLEGLRQRVESIGGTFRIQSEIGMGTRVVADLPLDLAVSAHAQ
jgi:signal transduction histidine kinase